MQCLSQIERNELNVIPVTVNIPKFIKKLEDLLSFDSYQKKLNLNFSCDPEIRKIMIDKKLITKVVNILLFNSLKYTLKGTITFTVYKLVNKIGFLINDTGIGIDKERVKTLFDPFSCAEKRLDSYETGTGIDLYMVKKIVQKMGGEINVFSVKNQFTSINLSFPFIPANEPSLSRVSSLKSLNLSVKPFAEEEIIALPKLPNSTQSYALYVLIVEDNTLNVFALKNMLEKHKIKCDVAYNGQEGLNLVKMNVYDLVFMDINMPVMLSLIHI